MEKSIFYHAGCSVCVGAEREVLKLIDKSKIEVVNLGVDKARITIAEEAGVQSVPALVTPTGSVLHINFGASLVDVKG